MKLKQGKNSKQKTPSEELCPLSDSQSYGQLPSLYDPGPPAQG